MKREQVEAQTQQEIQPEETIQIHLEEEIQQ